MQNETISYTNSGTGSEGRDNELWSIARRRAAFKISAASYVIINSMLIAVWYFTSGPGSYFWPIWSILGWGLGIATQYVRTYHGVNFFSTQREYEKLKRQQRN